MTRITRAPSNTRLAERHTAQRGPACRTATSPVPLPGTAATGSDAWAADPRSAGAAS